MIMHDSHFQAVYHKRIPYWQINTFTHLYTTLLTSQYSSIRSDADLFVFWRFLFVNFITDDMCMKQGYKHS